MEISALTPLAASATTDVDRSAGSPAAARAGETGLADAEQGLRIRQAAADAAVARAEPAGKPGWKQLETLLVQQMLQTMMTSEEGGFFGKELGSDYYASFMAEQFAARLSDGLDLGIASRLDRHYASGDER